MLQGLVGDLQFGLQSIQTILFSDNNQSEPVLGDGEPQRLRMRWSGR